MFASKDVKATQAITITEGAAGTTDIEGAVLDMSGFEEAVCVVQFGAIVTNAVTSIKWQEGEASDLSDAADVTGTAQVVADDDDNTVFRINIIKPRGRYGRVYVDRATQNATCAAMYYQAGARTLPVTDAATVAGETHVSPAEGTA